MKNIIGIFGGTFDPIHNGHLHVAHTLLATLPLKEIRFIPCYEPVHRQTPVASAEQRLKMCELALENENQLLVDDREIQREGKSFMIDTLQSLRKDLPNAPLALIIGADSFEYFTSWKSWKNIFDYSHLIVVNRQNTHLPQDPELNKIISRCITKNSDELNNKATGLIYFAHIPPSPVSATKLRELASSGKDISNSVPQKVLSYIQSEKIY